MQHSRLTRNLAIILLLSSALTIGLMPSVSSQQYTTSTSFLTSSLTQARTYYLPTFTISTSTGIETLTTTAEFQPLQGVCDYAWIGVFDSTGATHFEYSVSRPMTLYILDRYSLEAWTASYLWTTNCIPINGRVVPPFYQTSISSTNYPATGSFDVNLPPDGNEYAILLTTPLPEMSTTILNPTTVLTISPVVGAYTTTETISIPMTLTTSGTTTLTFFSTLEVPFTQTYGGWIVAAIVGFVIVFVAAWLALKRRVRPRKKRRS